MKPRHETGGSWKGMFELRSDSLKEKVVRERAIAQAIAGIHRE